MKEILITLSVIISSSGYLIGIWSILKGEFKPQRMTRLIILIVISISTLSLYLSGERVGLFLAMAQLTASFIFLVLSFKYGIGGTSKLDFAVLALAVITLVIWKLTDNPFIALYMAITTDFIGMLPTLIKAFRDPSSEEPKFYAADFIAGFLSLLALNSYNLADLVFPGYIFLINGFLVFMIIIRRDRVQKNLMS